MQRKRSAAKHASVKRVGVADTLSAWFRILSGRSTSGRHTMSARTEQAGGATPAWGDVLHGMNKNPVVRDEVRA